MKPLKKHTIKNQIYEIIKAKILNQELNFGDKINIDSLSSELQVSNTPIREALVMLEKDGLIVTTPNTGSRVFEFTQGSYKELTEVVGMLLIGGYKLCVSKNKLNDLISEMQNKLQDQQNLIQKEKNIELARAAISFDESLLIIPQNKKLISIYNGLFDMLYLAVLYDYQQRDTNKVSSILEHKKILDAIINAQHEKVEKLINEHYNRQLLFG